ncbi:HEAT repeat domain-containing protein [bacterium]|nr:HEAT repeat domain-containing protein [bacterium]
MLVNRSWILFYLTVFVSSLVSAEESIDLLSRALKEYEIALVKITQDGTDEEKAAALRALAAIASSHYPNVRDSLLATSSREIQKALIDAISDIGDQSKQAKDLILQVLKSNSPAQISRALELTVLKVDFRSVWNQNNTPFLWAKYFLAYPHNLDPARFSAIGQEKPWRDPAWTELSDAIRVQLLARAGTRESLKLLRNIPNWPAELPPGENNDPDMMMELLSDPDERIRIFAANSLLATRNPSYIRQCINKVDKILSFQSEKEKPLTAENIPFQSILRILSTKRIKKLIRSSFTPAEIEPASWRTMLSNELLSRGDPFPFKELTLENFPSVDWRTLLVLQMQALIRERSYNRLPAFISMIAEKHPDLLGILQMYLLRAPEFVAKMPEETADQSYSAIAGTSNYHLIGLFARGKHGEALWNRWKSSSGSREPQLFEPVLWGFNLRSKQLREMYYGDQDPHTPLPPYPLDRCRNVIFFIYKFPHDGGSLPLFPGRLWSATSGFLRSVTAVYRDQNVEALFRDFLLLRTRIQDSEDPDELISYYNDPRYSVRFAAWKLLAPRLPFLPENTYSPSSIYDQDSEFVNAYWTSRKHIENPKWSLPGQAFSDEDRNWLISIFAQERKDAFVKLMSPLQERAELDPVSMTDQWTQPFDQFTTNASRFVEELRSMSSTSDSRIRFAVLWALAVTSGDESARKELFTIASSENVTKTRALYLLQKMRYQPARNLYRSLLKHSDPSIRKLGLLGVQMFRLQEAENDVIHLIHDPDMLVARLATQTLSWMSSRQTRDILIDLLKENTMVGSSSHEALMQFRNPADIDHLAHLLSNTRLDPVQRERLFIIATTSTYREPVSFRIADPTEAELKMLIQEWVDWWNTKGKNGSKEDWIREMIQSYISALLQEPNSPTAWSAISTLEKLFSSQVSTGSFPDEKREEFQTWWNSHAQEDLWTTLTDDFISSGTRTVEVLDLLYDLDPGKAAQLAFGLRCYSYDDQFWQPWLAKHSNTHLPNVCRLACEKQDEAFFEWGEWVVTMEKNP